MNKKNIHIDLNEKIVSLSTLRIEKDKSIVLAKKNTFNLCVTFFPMLIGMIYLIVLRGDELTKWFDRPMTPGLPLWVVVIAAFVCVGEIFSHKTYSCAKW